MAVKEELQKLISELQAKKFREGEAKDLMSAIQAEQTAALKPVLESMAKSIGDSLKEQLSEAIKNIKVEVPKIEIPPINVKVPEAKITVTVPRIEVPPINVPEQKVVFPASFKLDTDRANPVPVILTDIKGAVYSISQFAGGGGGGGGKPIKQYQEADTDSLIKGLAVLGESDDALIPIQFGSGVSDRALRVVHATDVAQSVSFSGTVEMRQVSGSVDSVSVTEFAGGAQLNTLQASGSVDSVNVLQVGGTPVAANAGVANDGTLRVVQAVDSVVSVNVVSGSASGTEYADGAARGTATGTIGMVDDGTNIQSMKGDTAGRPAMNLEQIAGIGTAVGEGVANAGALRTVQAVDSVASVNVVSTVGLTDTQLRASTLDVKQVSGSSDSVVVNSVLTSLEVKQVSGSVDSVSVLDFPAGTLIQTLQLSGSTDSVVATGNIAHDGVDSGNPIKIGGIARQANPTAVAALDRVDATFDDLGRQVITPYQVRDLITTAYLALATGTETALLAGAASTFHDLVYVMGSNQSDAAVDVDFRSGTGGSVVFSLTIPADATAGVALPVPIPQTEVAQAWTADMADITGTTVNISALFIKNI